MAARSQKESREKMLSITKGAVAGAILAALACGLAAAPVKAQDIKVGITISMTGPAASLGLPQQKSITLLPSEVAGHKIEYLLLDDGSDTTKAVSNARKFIDESNVDAIIGSSTTPVSLAMIDVVAEKQVPMLSLAASQAVIAPMDAKKRWVFKMPQNDSLMADAVAEHMAANGVTTVGFIGFADAYGDGWLRETQRAFAAKNIKLVAIERYNRTDTSVTGQVAKILSAQPDAVLIVGSGTPAALPQKTLHELGYMGKYYQTHGVANLDFLRIGGKDVEGTFLPAGPIVIASQLADDHPAKRAATTYIEAFEKANGTGSVAFGSYAYDAGLLLQHAIPAALQKANPGTLEFRQALRDALEATHELPVANGVMSMSADNHNGLDRRARVMLMIENGKWKLLSQH
jgi:branched-chain amino acid transport system substrate-binding protein